MAIWNPKKRDSSTSSDSLGKESLGAEGLQPQLGTDPEKHGQTVAPVTHAVTADSAASGEKLSKNRSDPFASVAGDRKLKYKSMKWWQATFVLVAETISLGILSLPSVLGTVGLVPGIILLIFCGAVATYTGYTIWQFKMRYPHVVNMADAGEVLLGAWGREILGGAQVVLLVFASGSHILTFTIAMNVITGHATCTIAWAFIGLAIFFVCSLPRKMEDMTWFSIVGK